MSTDVYIDFWPGTFEAPEADPKWESEWLGHVAMLDVYRPERHPGLLERVRSAVDFYPCVTEQAIGEMVATCRSWEKWLAVLDGLDPEAFCEHYGEKPDRDTWDSHPDPEDVAEWGQYLGWKWRVRID